MNWKNYFSTSIGKKLQMSLTGLFLILFLIVHCYVNLQIFVSAQAFLDAAHFMGTNLLIRTVEIGLFAFLILHIVQGLLLYAQNRSKRPSRYAVSAGNATSKWYSRSMALLGTLILLFLVIHLANFWVPNRYNQFTTGEELNLYELMRTEFQVAWVVVVYVLGCFSLAWHLVHGFYSAFQTLGLGTHKYKSMIKAIGIGFSVIVSLVFAAMPIAFFIGYLK